MIILRIKDLQGTQIEEFYLSEGTHTIGRVPENTITIKDMKVSRKHAQLVISGNQCIIQDSGSRTGVFLNETKVTEAEIRDGDKISLGGDQVLEIAFADDRASKAEQGKIGRLEAAAQDMQQDFFLQKPETIMGRVPECDIQVPDKQSSREHCKIIHDGEHYFAEDMKSANGTKVNGAKISKHLLKVGDLIEIGEFKYRFSLCSASEMQELQKTRMARAKSEPEEAPPVAGASQKPVKKSSSLFKWFIFLLVVGGGAGAGYHYREEIKPYLEPVIKRIEEKFGQKDIPEGKDQKPIDPSQPKADEAIPVSAMQVEKRTFVSYFEETGGVEPAAKIHVVSSLESQFLKVHVKEGQYVEKDQLLVLLDDRFLQKDKETAEAEMQKAKAGYEGAVRIFKTAGDALKLAIDQRDKMKRLFDQGVIPETRYTEAKQKYYDADQNNEKAKSEMQRLRDEIKTIQTKIAKIEERLKDVEIRAHISGIVDQLTAKEGEYPRNPIMQILDINEIFAVPRITQRDVVEKIWKERELFSLDISSQEMLNNAQFPDDLKKKFQEEKIVCSEKIGVKVQTRDYNWLVKDPVNHKQYAIRKQKDVLRVIECQPATVYSSAYSGVEFHGFVDEIDTTVRESDRSIQVKVKVSNPDLKLKPGSFVKVKFVVGEHKDVLAIPKTAVVTIDRKKCVYLVQDVTEKDGTKVEKVFLTGIETNYEDDKFFEIKSSEKEIKDKQLIVVEGQSKLSNESVVKIVK